MILSGVFLFGWFYVAYQPYYGGGELMSGEIVLATVLALALGVGGGGGASPVDVIVGAVKDAVPTMIALGAAWIVSTLLYQFVMPAQSGGFDVMGLVHSVAVVVAATVMTALTAASLRNAQ